MASPLEGRRVVLGVTGSIACFKAVDLASKLTQAGAAVDVVLTRGATNFLTPLTFGSITHGPVVTDVYDPQSELSMDHIAMAERAEVIVIAPATANTMAKLAWGFADDALTTTVLATGAPVIVAPAMDANMYENAATQENVERLRKRGVVIAGAGARGGWRPGWWGGGAWWNRRRSSSSPRSPSAGTAASPVARSWSAREAPRSRSIRFAL